MQRGYLYIYAIALSFSPAEEMELPRPFLPLDLHSGGLVRLAPRLAYRCSVAARAASLPYVRSTSFRFSRIIFAASLSKFPRAIARVAAYPSACFLCYYNNTRDTIIVSCTQEPCRPRHTQTLRTSFQGPFSMTPGPVLVNSSSAEWYVLYI